MSNRESKIDFVIPWVDPGDPKWQKERAQHAPGESADGSEIRYRDFDNLQYWFRGIEKFAPWVNKVHFITYGHLPPWLNTNHPKLNIVYHKDYIPEEYLPTFSSHVIEVNLHRIKGLSDQFVYFNDDIFVLKKIRPGDFFKDGLPRDVAALNISIKRDTINSHAVTNIVYIINKHFNKRASIGRNFFKWYNPINGKYLIRTLLLALWGVFPGIQITHLTNAYLKSTFEKVWEAEGEELHRTSANKFRDKEDLMQNVFKFWQLASGSFKPRGKIGKYFDLSIDSAKACSAIRKQRYKIVCLNDQNEIENFETLKEEIITSFNKILPEKSEFEIS